MYIVLITLISLFIENKTWKRKYGHPFIVVHFPFLLAMESEKIEQKMDIYCPF